MSHLTKLFNKYVKIMKVLTTFVGTSLIYFTAVLLGKAIYLFVAREDHRKWQSYQSGLASDKMF